MSVEFRRASPEDARLLAETRRRAWDTTYRGIYPDAMIDEYDLEAHTARDAARIADPANAVFLAMDGAECVGYFTYGPYTYDAIRTLHSASTRCIFCRATGGWVSAGAPLRS